MSVKYKNSLSAAERIKKKPWQTKWRQVGDISKETRKEKIVKSFEIYFTS